jgi:hypothetical protein
MPTEFRSRRPDARKIFSLPPLFLRPILIVGGCDAVQRLTGLQAVDSVLKHYLRPGSGGAECGDAAANGGHAGAGDALEPWMKAQALTRISRINANGGWVKSEV